MPNAKSSFKVLERRQEKAYIPPQHGYLDKNFSKMIMLSE
jgi:hypothetical protein